MSPPEGIQEKRKELLLYFLDVIIFGVIVSTLFLGFESFLRNIWSNDILFVIIGFLVILGLIVFKLIVTPTKIQEKMSCALVHNRLDGIIEYIHPIMTPLSVLAHNTFEEITKKNQRNKRS
jgi:hypothetical protein